jgi:outer membrane immunogenic protein
MPAPIRVALSLATVLFLAALWSFAPAARAQTGTPTPSISRADVAVAYNYAHSNAPPGGCGCFNLYGAGGDFAWFIKPARFALVGDLSVTRGGAVSTSGGDLELSAVTFGGRYLPPLRSSSWHPFGQVLAGVAHASGTLVQGTSPASANAGAAFAANIGGGLDWGSGPFSIRVVDAEYFLTHFDNGSNDHQNNLRLGAGLVLHF